MSFLNPVNEPVIRFSSTDAGAPQINYNARVAGDIKAVLKACLVTGYGDTASAGWTAVNETATVIEFVSPSAAMSDYRLGIDDTSAASTTWYYRYQDVRVNPKLNTQTKSITPSNSSHASNGWQLLVTERGLFFIESVYNTGINISISRVSYWGQVKSALADDKNVNIAYWCAGFAAASSYPNSFFAASETAKKDFSVGAFKNIQFSSANIATMSSTATTKSESVVDLIDSIYLYDTNTLVGVQPGLLLRMPNNTATFNFMSTDISIDGRPALQVTFGASLNIESQVRSYSRFGLIYLDYWGY